VRSGCAGRGNTETSTSSVHAIGEMGDPRCGVAGNLLNEADLELFNQGVRARLTV